MIVLQSRHKRPGRLASEPVHLCRISLFEVDQADDAIWTDLWAYVNEQQPQLRQSSRQSHTIICGPATAKSNNPHHKKGNSMHYRVPVRTEIQLFKYVEVENDEVNSEVGRLADRNEVHRRCEAAAEQYESDDPKLVPLTGNSVQDAIEALRLMPTDLTDLQWQPGLIGIFEEVTVDEDNEVICMEEEARRDAMRTAQNAEDSRDATTHKKKGDRLHQHGLQKAR
jgi:hypothetical protein